MTILPLELFFALATILYNFLLFPLLFKAPAIWLIFEETIGATSFCYHKFEPRRRGPVVLITKLWCTSGNHHEQESPPDRPGSVFGNSDPFKINSRLSSKQRLPYGKLNF